MIRCRMKWHPRWIGYVVALPDELLVTNRGWGHILKCYKAGHPFTICERQHNGGLVSMVPDGEPDTTITISIAELNRGGLLVLATPHSLPQDRPRNSWEIPQ